MNQEEFISRASEVWGDRWDYTSTKYLSIKKDVSIRCKEHDSIFTQLARKHISGQIGCPICTGRVRNTDDFIRYSISKWGDRWDYSKTEYQSAQVPVVIICKEHSYAFSQTPALHNALKVGCPLCHGRNLSIKDFLIKATKVWGDRWDYSNTEIVGVPGEMKFICRLHGSFLQRSSSHLSGKIGCKYCVSEDKQRDFLVRANEMWGDRWDYSQVAYHNLSTPIIIRCKEHGDFNQLPKKHLRGDIGCYYCGGSVAVPEGEMERRARDYWGERWDYSNTNFSVRAHDYITVRCPKHGEFNQTVENHVYFKKVGCVGCIRESSILGRENIVSRAKEVWGDRWDYTSSTFETSKDTSEVTCYEHGPFYQSVDSLLRGHVGCPECEDFRISSGEREIAAFLRGLDLEVVSQNREILRDKGLEVDIYLPELSIGIEFNGVYWHCEKFKGNLDHYNKYKAAEDTGLHLIQIWEDDWRFRNEVVKEHLRRVVGRSQQPKVSARNCSLKEVSSSSAREFMSFNHLQGFAASSVYLGLFSDDSLVALASFKKRGADYELTRYATSCIVRGGHSKLVKAFEDRYQFGKLITFADLSFGSGNLYEVTGWVKDKILPPDYMYLVGNRRKHKFGYRIGRFKKDPKLKYEEGLTERGLASLNNLLRVYDAGKVRYIKEH